MDTQRWLRMQDIFDAALAHPSQKRAEFLEQACEGDVTLEAELLSLLQSDMGSEGLLGSVIDEAANTLPALQDPEIGLKIGPYQLVKEIGRGGMGVVYLAVRSDPHYLQTVAIKLIRRGYASGTLLQRFRQERQILANLTHPNIAAILDGGSTGDGRPYIVMEYIEGEPITDYCETAKLDFKGRIQLFRTVCAAVHYAHQKLVIHRDLKPGNVLVRSDGSPKLIDFGVSKLLVPELIPGGPVETEISHRMLTPDYASPEQIQGKALSTQTDIYSLGVTLYELLAGRRPFDLPGRSSSQFEQMVCVEDPRRPSEANGLPAPLRKELKGDLDNIVLKAMAKDPRDRYNSAEQLSDDLGRYLNGDPVIARHDTFRYRTGKLVRRYRTALISTVLIVISLIGGLVATTRQMRRTEQRFDQVRQLASLIIFDVSEGIRDLPGTTEARASLVKAALPYLDSLATDSASDPVLLWDLGRAYSKIGDVQGAPAVPNLGHPADSLVSYGKALRAFNAIGAGERRQDRVTQALIDIHHKIGLLQTHMGGSTSALEHYRESVKIAQEHFAENPQDEERQRLLASSYNRLGDSQRVMRDAPGSLKSFRTALAAFGGVEPKSDQARRDLSTVYIRVGDALMETGPVPEAVENLYRAVVIREDLSRRKPSSHQFRRDLFVAYSTMGDGVGGNKSPSMGDFPGALMWFNKSLQIAEELSQQDPRNSQARSDLAFAYSKVGEVTRFSDPAAAAQWYRRSLAITGELLATAPSSIETRRWNGERRVGLSDALDRMGDLRGALNERQGAHQTWLDLAKAEPARLDLQQYVVASYCSLCDLHRRLQDTQFALNDKDRAIREMGRLLANRSSLSVLRDLANCYEAFARLEEGLGGYEHWMQARAWRRQSLDVWNEWQARGAGDPPSVTRRNAAVSELARAEAAVRKFEDQPGAQLRR